MNENVFTPLVAVPKSIEVCSLVEQMEKQYITAGEYLSKQIADKLREEKADKVFKPREYMEAQRSYTWEKWRASNFIVSVMLHGEMPSILLYRKDDKDQYKKTVDGQQRLTTLWLFVNDILVLDMSKFNFAKFPFGDKVYSTKADLHGKTFSQLPQEWQDSIMHYSFDVKIYNNCSDAQAERLYTEMANGTKPLKAIEIRKAAMGIEVRNFIYDIIDKRWILHMMTKSSARGSRGIDVLTQLMTLIDHGAIELSRDNIDEMVYNFRDFGMPNNVKDSLLSTSEYLDKMFDFWITNKKEADKNQTKGRKVKNYSTYKFPMFTNKTTTLMVMWAGYKAQSMNVDVNDFQKWAFEFFQNPSKRYKMGLANGSTKVGDYNNVKIRMDAIEDELSKLSKGETVSDTEDQDVI